MNCIKNERRAVVSTARVLMAGAFVVCLLGFSLPAEAQPVRAQPTPQLRVQLPLQEDCIPFDYRRAEVKQVGGRWKIVVGNMWMLDFGSDQTEARLALVLIEHYRMNKQCFVGRPQASMKYFLVNDASPTGGLRAEDCLAFQSRALAVKNFNGRWKIVEGNRWLMDFGSDLGEARTALRIILKYGFTRTCFVGRPDPSMSYLRR